ncbi:Uncharacterised protein [BD1-7 clade bacterium]|uniref:Uncharacterized protein n=1 Tax=BD1-7 clade bacterium TaxID=2029982 RepID=A0A5S9NJ23_9GAMM|nr:Uncharacterised protein [BD1-7 clade bacterium]CAA0093259.1 Uncharacterised protein [BD1-7 clade bacterium]CAA0121858.1 Uncharacterised protein [BD1-7 clade bacterium]
MSYLCEKHRQELQNNPEKAQQLYQHWFDTAQTAASQQEMSTAIKACGWAFDAAQTLVNSVPDATQTLEAIDRLIQCGGYLATLYQHLGQHLNACTLLNAITEYLLACEAVQGRHSETKHLIQAKLRDVQLNANAIGLVH